MRTHIYIPKKGYADQYKGLKITWDVPETIEEAISSGQFPDEKTIVRKAVNQLNIERGHAIQRATVEKVKDADGKETAELANPNLTVAQMEAIARSVNASATVRGRSAGGSVKERAEKFATSQQKAKELAATASPETLAALAALGYDVPAPAEKKSRNR